MYTITLRVIYWYQNVKYFTFDCIFNIYAENYLNTNIFIPLENTITNTGIVYKMCLNTLK